MSNDHVHYCKTVSRMRQTRDSSCLDGHFVVVVVVVVARKWIPYGEEMDSIFSFISLLLQPGYPVDRALDS